MKKPITPEEEQAVSEYVSELYGFSIPLRLEDAEEIAETLGFRAWHLRKAVRDTVVELLEPLADWIVKLINKINKDK